MPKSKKSTRNYNYNRKGKAHKLEYKTNMIKKFGQSDRNGVRFKGIGFLPVENKNDNSFINDEEAEAEAEESEAEESEAEESEAEESDIEHGLDN